MESGGFIDRDVVFLRQGRGEGGGKGESPISIPIPYNLVNSCMAILPVQFFIVSSKKFGSL